MSIILTGKKVILRPLSLKDAPNFCRWLADPEVTQFLEIHDLPKPSLKEERDWIKQAQVAKNKISFSIDTIKHQHIGTVSLDKISEYHKRVSFGIFIGDKEYWGQGYGTEAVKLILDYGFRKLRLHRIYLSVIAFNFRAQKAYKKVGFKFEGKFRQHMYRNGAWHDLLWMGVLQEEYLKKFKSKK